MDNTPRTRSSTRKRHEPSPKISERKKKLFADESSPASKRNIFTRSSDTIAEEDDDSDLGPMSPLQFSPSSSNSSVLRSISGTKANNVRTSFLNIMHDVSSPKRQSKRKLEGPANGKRTGDTNEDDMVEPLCTSMKNLASAVDLLKASTASAETLGKTQDYEQQMRTPDDMAKLTDSGKGAVARGVSSKKSLVFDTGRTPDAKDASAASVRSSDADGSDGPKAKASLSFTETAIPTRSFYGKMSEPTIAAPKPSVEWLLHRLPQAKVTKKPSEARLKQKLRTLRLAQRMKSPCLWRLSGKKMKLNKFVGRSKAASLSKSSSSSSSSSKPNTSVSSSGHDTSTQPNADSEQPKAVYTSNIEQNLRLQKILKDQRKNMDQLERSIAWNGDEVASGSAQFSDSEYESDEAGAENTDPQKNVAAGPEEQSKRKFFKSSSKTSAKYRVMGRISATVKRGGDMKLQSMPKRKKQRMNKDDTSLAMDDEISCILNRLWSPSKAKPTNIEIIEDIYVPVSADIALPLQLEAGTQVLPSASSDEAVDVVEIDDEMYAEPSIEYDSEALRLRTRIPYNTTDPAKISQQLAILDLLVVNGICNDETFTIFIAEPDLHKDKANEILDNLYSVVPMEFQNGEGADYWNADIETTYVPITADERQQIITPKSAETGLSSSTAIAAASTGVRLAGDGGECSTSMARSTSTQGAGPSANDTAMPSTSTSKVFPIFEKNFGAAEAKRDAQSPSTALKRATREWRPIGDHQFQIDAGQKNFGVRKCTQCNMQYSAHEPEDEMLHLRFHSCVETLSFKGWANERVVADVPEWSVDGRIICVYETDSKAKRDRVKEILDLVERDLGIMVQAKLMPKTLVYLGVSKQQIVGVCVAHSISKAFRMEDDEGIDCYSMESYPAKCGISRIWVAPAHRRRGVAGKLVTAVRSHFIYGSFLTFDELAFSAPTEAGKRLASSLTKRSDFLIYA